MIYTFCKRVVNTHVYKQQELKLIPLFPIYIICQILVFFFNFYFSIIYFFFFGYFRFMGVMELVSNTY